MRKLNLNGKEGIVPISHLHVNYGYALTTHKAQGSQWENVFVCLEPGVYYNREDGLRRLYTAITRTQRNLALCV